MSPEPQVAILSEPLALERPAMRGMLHLGGAIAALGGMAWLLVVAASPTGYVGAAVFATSVILLYATSATYHGIEWRPTARRVLQRIDHAMIFVLIAGTYTPFCLKVSLAWGIPLLSVVWAVAGAGVLLKVIWPQGPRALGVALYLALGWMAIIAASEVISVFAITPITMLIAGGVLYSVGSIMYAVRRPNPWPKVFGYHEVFHVFVIAGSVLHFSVVGFYVVPS